MAYVPKLTQRDLYKMQKKKERARKLEWARNLYNQGISLYEISKRTGLPEWTLVTELGLG